MLIDTSIMNSKQSGRAYRIMGGTAEIRVLAITTLGEDYRFSDSIGGAGELGQASLARGPFLELLARRE